MHLAVSPYSCAVCSTTLTNASALYPPATFQDKVSLTTISAWRLEEYVLVKYMSRGWRFIHEVPAPPPEVLDAVSSQLMRAYLRASECGHCPHCEHKHAEERSIACAFPAGPRWIGDAHAARQTVYECVMAH